MKNEQEIADKIKEQLEQLNLTIKEATDLGLIVNSGAGQNQQIVIKISKYINYL